MSARRYRHPNAHAQVIVHFLETSENKVHNLPGLWCVWELFTLLAFTSREQAGRKIEFIPMLDTNQTVADVLQPLRLF
jgi:hypothetical protein